MYILTDLLTTIAALAATTLAAPTTSSTTQDPNCNKRHFLPTLHNIYIYKSQPQFPSTSTVLNIMSGSTSGSSQDQVALWTSIPTTATHCTIGWAVEPNRSFSVYDNGLVRWQQMTGMPAAGTNVTLDTVAPFRGESGARNASMDFTFWPEVGAVKSGGVGGAVDCRSEVAVYLYKDLVYGGKGSVTLEQTEANGLYLDVQC